jgi:hypothetical protein
MQQRLRSGEHVRCKLNAERGGPLHFTVRSCPEYGILEIVGHGD